MTEVKTVRLGDLEHDPVAIVGHEKRITQLDDLLASMPVKGQLQSLNVRPATDSSGKLWVKAGNRRLATLRSLRDAGGAIKDVVVTDDFPVAVIESDENDADAYETSRSENMQRLPETPLEEFRAFAKMAETKPPKEIAATFGVTEKRVLQRLKLAQLHPDVLAAIEDGRVSMEAAEAFTLAEPDKQAKYLKKAQSYQLDAYAIRRAFTDTLINGKSPIAKIIGLAAYKKAGGKVMGDVFTDDAYWLSKDLIDDLLLAHWEAEVAKWKAEGWSFVETVEQYCGSQGWKVQQSEQLKPEGKGKGKDAVPVFTAEQKASAGVVYYPDGSRAPSIGIKRYKEARNSNRVPDADLDYPPSDLAKALREQVTNAIVGRVAGDPLFALRMLVAALMEGGGYGRHGSPLDFFREFSIDEDESGDEPERAFGDELAKLSGKPADELLSELARILAQGISIPHGGVDPAMMMLLAAELYFDADAYFKGLTKPYLDLAWKDMTGPKEKAPKGKVEELMVKCQQRAAETGWVPPQLRTPSYAGPCFVTKLAKDEGGDPDVEDDAFNDDESQLEAAE